MGLYLTPLEAAKLLGTLQHILRGLVVSGDNYEIKLLHMKIPAEPPEDSRCDYATCDQLPIS